MRNFPILLLVGLLYQINTQVLGIDFGTEFWKAALISPGKNLVIVENTRSQRKTLNSIAFSEGIRHFEDDSLSKRLKKPDLSYFYLNKLIRSLDNKQTITAPQFNGETYVFNTEGKQMTLEQIVGMILKNVKSLASHQAGTDIRDVVIAVPANWGFNARISLVNAALFADFSVLGLINENSAAAIQFAISRNDTDPINVVLFNYGSHNLQISVVKAFGLFDEQKNKTIESIETLSHVTIQDVGGLKVDERIADYLAQQFLKKHKVDPRKNKKSYIKLLNKASNAKQTLSANKETTVYIQGLIDGIDLNLPLSRQVIQECAHFNEFSKYFEQALVKAKIQKSDVNQVQIIGGASRIPRVWNTVKQYFNEYEDVTIGSHINGDQSVAFGSALRAANLSLTFRVKQLHFYDPMNLQTRVVISSEDSGVLLEQKLFDLADHHGSRKTVSLNHNDEDIKITVYGGEQIVREFTTKGIPDWKKKHENDNLTSEPNLVIQFLMSSINIADVKDIYLNVTINVTSVKEKVQYVDEEVQVQVEIKQKQKEKETENVDTSQQGQQNNEQTQEQPKQQEQQKQETAETAEKKTKKITKTKTVKTLVQEHDIKNKKHLPSAEQTFSKYKKFSKQEVEEKKKLLQEFEKYQKDIKQKAKIRNDFESALYNLKNNFEEEYLKTFSTQDELTKLIDTVTQKLEWLDQNAWTATKEEFEEHFKILGDSYNPIYNRTTEYRNREKTYNESLNYLGMVYQKTSDLLDTHTWIKEKVQDQLKKINQTAEWIGQRIAKQIKRPLNENPIIYNHELIQKAEELRNQYYTLKMIQRPKIDIDNIMKDIKKKMEEEEKQKKQQEQAKNAEKAESEEQTLESDEQNENEEQEL